MSATTVLLVFAGIVLYTVFLAFVFALLGAAKLGDEHQRPVTARGEPPAGPNHELGHGRFTADDDEFLQALDRQARSASGARAAPRHPSPG